MSERDAVGRELFSQELRVLAERVRIDVDLRRIGLVQKAGRRQLEGTMVPLATRRDLQRLCLVSFGATIVGPSAGLAVGFCALGTGAAVTNVGAARLSLSSRS